MAVSDFERTCSEESGDGSPGGIGLYGLDHGETCFVLLLSSNVNSTVTAVFIILSGQHYCHFESRDDLHDGLGDVGSTSLQSCTLPHGLTGLSSTSTNVTLQSGHTGMVIKCHTALECIFSHLFFLGGESL